MKPAIQVTALSVSPSLRAFTSRLFRLPTRQNTGKTFAIMDSLPGIPPQNQKQAIRNVFGRFGLNSEAAQIPKIPFFQFSRL